VVRLPPQETNKKRLHLHNLAGVCTTFNSRKMKDFTELTLDEAVEYYNDDEQRELIEYWLKIYGMIYPHKGLK